MSLNCVMALQYDSVPEHPKIPNTVDFPKHLRVFIMVLLFCQKY